MNGFATIPDDWSQNYFIGRDPLPYPDDLVYRMLVKRKAPVNPIPAICIVGMKSKCTFKMWLQ